jgi:DnaK suppressor protein
MLAKNKNYRPSDKEPFMNERQRDYFRAKLLAWREDILKEAKETLQHLQEENQNHPDLADRASSETDRAIELRARDRQRKLIAKIDEALTRIDDGTYGYCEETGEPISLRRLEARPIATLSVEAQERHERRERVYRDDRDRDFGFEETGKPGDRAGLFAIRVRASGRGGARRRNPYKCRYRGRMSDSARSNRLPSREGRRGLGRNNKPAGRANRNSRGRHNSEAARR